MVYVCIYISIWLWLHVSPNNRRDPCPANYTELLCHVLFLNNCRAEDCMLTQCILFTLRLLVICSPRCSSTWPMIRPTSPDDPARLDLKRFGTFMTTGVSAAMCQTEFSDDCFPQLFWKVGNTLISLRRSCRLQLQDMQFFSWLHWWEQCCLMPRKRLSFFGSLVFVGH